MAKRHSEDKAIKSVARVCKVDAKAKTLQVSKGPSSASRRGGRWTS